MGFPPDNCFVGDIRPESPVGHAPFFRPKTFFTQSIHLFEGGRKIGHARLMEWHSASASDALTLRWCKTDRAPFLRTESYGFPFDIRKDPPFEIGNDIF